MYNAVFKVESLASLIVQRSSISDDEYEERIRLLETSVGIPTIEKATRIDEKGNPYEVKISATGLYKQIEELEKRFNNFVKNSNGGN